MSSYSGQPARVHDPHVEPGVDGVEEEGAVHRLAHDVVAAEGEGEVRDAARHEDARASLLQERDGVDERLREQVVLLDPRGHGEDVGVEDDVLRREPGLLREQVVGAAENLDLALHRVGLPSLVERHHHDAGAVAAHLAGLGEEVLLPLLERDGVDDPLPLQALETRDGDLPARAVDHHGECARPPARWRRG